MERFENYALAKERIFAVQDANDFVVLNADNPRTAEAEARSHAPVYWFSAKARSEPRRMGRERKRRLPRPAPDAAIETVMPLSKIPLKGEHNVENVLAAVCAARLAGVAPAAIGRAIEKFQRRRASTGICGHRSMASITTTTRRPPTWMRPPRPWRRFPAAFI